MEILKKMAQKTRNNAGCEGVTIAFLGDSVTQGCFEIYKKNDGSIETIFDKRNAYSQAFADMLSVLYPSVPVNIINAGIMINKFNIFVFTVLIGECKRQFIFGTLLLYVV